MNATIIKTDRPINNWCGFSIAVIQNIAQGIRNATRTILHLVEVLYLKVQCFQMNIEIALRIFQNINKTLSNKAFRKTKILSGE